MSEARWQFWIDVGGTFTDCVARAPNGATHRHKRLSSGVTKGTLAEASDRRRILDPARSGDPEGFWNAADLRLLDAEGQLVEQAVVATSHAESGELILQSELGSEPQPGQTYELRTAEGAPVQAIRHILGLGREGVIPPIVVRLGTTRGTNALITRRGAKTALVTTKGFGDVLRIGYQNRPDLFRLRIEKPTPLFDDVLEVDERLTAEGEVLKRPDLDSLRGELKRLRDLGVQSLAICLLHAYRFADHEQLIGRLARELGFEEVSLSSDIVPLIKIVSRGDTTVVNAYLNPVLRSYVRELQRSLAGSCDDEGDVAEMRLLTSAGGLVSADQFVGKDSILSGPAGGVVGFSQVARAAGFERSIGFDMGGTSTDVSRYDGRYDFEYETEKAGVRVVAPMMAIETVAAGGGSLCGFDGVKLTVGPDSAGADPGPACYGRGGPLAVTDVNLFLGKLLPQHFPFPLEPSAVQRRLEQLADSIYEATSIRYDPHELAEGCLQVANANMVKAIRSISIAKGYDPRDYVLVAFGGAAGQHACAVADELRINRILNHPDAGILSAYGIGLADVTRHAASGVYRPYSPSLPRELESEFQRMAERCRNEVLGEGVATDKIETRRSLDLRYQGVDAWLTVSESEQASYAERFEQLHRQRYGYVHEGRSLEVVAARVEVIGRSDAQPQSSGASVDRRERKADETTPIRFHGAAHAAAVFRRESLRPGDVLQGPALVLEANSTTVVDPGWRAEMLNQGELLLVHGQRDLPGDPPDNVGARKKPSTGERPKPAETESVADPVMLEVFNNHFAGIAEQMGITLRNTSSSVNVKERLDFSCAIFTPSGDLVVNAPHIPVHLGAMSETVKCLLRDNAELRPGDVLITNDPYRGGSHLPDVTVVTPVFDEGGPLLFLTASRAHHAEIGGVRPGSMPPFSKNLAEEGVLISNFKLVDQGHSRVGELEQLLRSGPYPSRAVADNLADVAAQVAANKQGADDLLRLIELRGAATVQSYMRHIQDAAAKKMRSALSRLPAGSTSFVEHLDDGSPIAVTVTTSGDSAVIDFTGSGGVLPDNLNANRAIVVAAVMYVLRCLIDEDIPLNQGVLEPVRIVLPEGLLNPPPDATPETSPAVVGGNVETSQRVVDALLGCLNLAAASQGTMNNLLFGDETFGYYETICGGSGAVANSPGTDAVHTHMTNTRLTDPEVLEQRYPVRVLEFCIRRGSGGDGRHRGGDGVVRRLEFLRPLEVSILSQRRGPYAPYGLEGGLPGDCGRNQLESAAGPIQTLPGRVELSVEAGDVLTIETPGGGGFGEAS